MRELKTMRGNRLAFVLFSLAILLSIVREWSAPVLCAAKSMDGFRGNPAAVN